MNATEKFIRDAIEGGWNGYNNLLPQNLKWVKEGLQNAGLYKMLLDPAAWQAVGKVRGWARYTWTSWKGWSDHSIEYPSDDDAYNPPTDNAYAKRHITHELRMHGLIDALCDGKSIEEYLTSIE